MHSPVEWPWRETHETRTHDNRSQYGLIRNQFCIRKIEGVLPSCLGFGSRPSRDLLISISTNNEQRKQRTIKQTMGGGKATKKQRRQGSPFSIHVIAEITWTCRGYLKVAQWHTMEMLVTCLTLDNYINQRRCDGLPSENIRPITALLWNMPPFPKYCC